MISETKIQKIFELSKLRNQQIYTIFSNLKNRNLTQKIDKF